ncbi:putative methyltransferase [Rubripirellula amarantea]|uniref:Putative methyltransferase n=1 Tax=Rubripirellula amarantea TaxID=2527999 RepID=A0A5C5WPT6_9BACT|nr:class I SAM-dependent methyltransferase [Rubripirellula amarantea]TWT52688.1 putative methyltransferase [Rubripirellula amarantea]
MNQSESMPDLSFEMSQDADLAKYDSWWPAVLRCPICSGSLAWGLQKTFCTDCQQNYWNDESKKADFRPRHPVEIPLSFRLPHQSNFSVVEHDVLEFAADHSWCVDPAKLPRHLTPELASHIPAAEGSGSRCLDLGCGAGDYRNSLEDAGYEWIGFDYEHKEAPFWADAHAIPLADCTVDFVISLAVLEHVLCPAVVLREVKRVLKPGGTFIGSVAYLVPFHDHASYFNMTHFGVHAALVDAGFSVDWIKSDPNYLGIRALSYTGMFQGLPRSVSYLMVSPVVAAYRSYWWLRRRFGIKNSSVQAQLALNTGAWAFRATAQP